MAKRRNLDKLDEEFNNFMYRVTEVGDIIHNLASTDEELQKIGQLRADKYLGEKSEKVLEEIDEEKVVLTVKNSRTVINRKALEVKDQATMSQEAFMREVESDANRRYQDKLVRKERMETLKKRATLAFRRGEYEKAATLYGKAIEQIKDCPLLYNNRALTYINLKLYEKAERDLVVALKFNEDCLRSWLLRAKCHYAKGDLETFEECVEEARKRNPDDRQFITEYAANIKNSDLITEQQ